MESIYAYVLDRLGTWKGRWPKVAKGSKVSRRTIEKIFHKDIEDPGISHIEKLARFFRAEDAKADRKRLQ